MALSYGTRPVRGQMVALNGTYATGLSGPVVLAYGASTVRISGFFRNRRGNFGGKPRYRKFAVRADDPENAAFTEGTAVVDDLPFAQDFSLAGLGAFLWLQPLHACAITSGAVAAEALGSLQAWTDSTARIVAQQRVQAEPSTNTGKSVHLALGRPFPALGVSGVMIAVAARGVFGSPTMNFVGRTFTGDPTLPSAWDTTGLLGTDKTFATTNEDYNTGNLAYAPIGVAMAQIGLRMPAVDAYGEFDVTVAVKY